MNSDDTFWLGIWRLVAVFLIALVLSTGGCSVYTKHLIAESIKNGVNPFDAECSLSSLRNSDTECAIRSSR